MSTVSAASTMRFHLRKNVTLLLAKEANCLASWTAKCLNQASQPLGEAQRYLEQPCIPEDNNPLLWWNAQESLFPTLAKVAKCYLATQASSAPMERLFSIAGKIFRPDRCVLADDTFENLMFIKCNHTALK